jgi:predicted permease
MFLTYFKMTSLAVTQIFILGAIGYFLVKKNILGQDGLQALSRLLIEVIFPLFIFSQLIQNFSFDLYPDWWIFPLLSIAITVAGLLAGGIFLGFVRGTKHRLQFLSLVTFQNSGYLPLALIAALFAQNKTDTLFIYIFLFLLGFDLIVWSFGVYMLTFVRTRKFELGSLFSPPVITNLLSLFLISLGLNKIIPGFVLKPLGLVGSCTLPLAMFVVGGNIASLHLRHIDKKAIFFALLAKLVLLPLAGFWLIIRFKVPELMGLLILMQLAMPPATSLSVIIRHYQKEDLFISQGVFFGHILSLITIPLFLSLYFALVMIQ